MPQHRLPFHPLLIGTRHFSHLYSYLEFNSEIHNIFFLILLMFLSYAPEVQYAQMPTVDSQLPIHFCYSAVDLHVEEKVKENMVVSCKMNDPLPCLASFLFFFVVMQFCYFFCKSGIVMSQNVKYIHVYFISIYSENNILCDQARSHKQQPTTASRSVSWVSNIIIFLCCTLLNEVSWFCLLDSHNNLKESGIL